MAEPMVLAAQLFHNKKENKMALTKIVVNCETGVTEEIELTAEEIAELELAQAQAELDRQAREAEETARAEAKVSAQAKLTALGLTDAEVAALLG